MHQVYKAEPFRYGAMSSICGDARYMLFAQHDFPDTYEDDERRVGWDHDRILQNDYTHARECCTRHTNGGDLGIGDWAREASKEEIIAFIADMLKAPADAWTGCRVMGTVNVSNGYPVFTLELFAKRPDSATKVYTGQRAPNVGLNSSSVYSDQFAQVSMN